MAKRVIIGENVDIISSLPDEVLRRILSFLPTKIGVSTCILSTRWRYLFPFSNNLDFDDSLLVNPQRHGRHSNDTVRHFIDFVDRCIMLMNDTHVDKLRFVCNRAVATSWVDSWIRAAPLHNVRELDLCLCLRDFLTTPLSVFACTALVVLKLGGDFFLNVPDPVDLPCLKSLHLDSVEFLDDVSTQRLFSGCPLLEDLSIVGCSMVNIHELNLSSRSLKRLDINNYGTERCSCNFVLDAPGLVYLSYFIRAGEGYTLMNLHSLSEAHISINPSCFYFEPLDFPAIAEFLQGIGKVQSLSLLGDYMMYLEAAADELPLLMNVTSLTLTDQSRLKLSVVMKLLQWTPNLEELIFSGLFQGLYLDGCVDVPSCVSSRLKAIYYRVVYDDDDDDDDDDGVAFQKDLELLEYFLKNAFVLEKMWIYISSVRFDQKVVKHWRTMRETIEKLSRSKNCEIRFYRELGNINMLL